MYAPWAGRKFGVEMEMNDVKTSGANLLESELKAACHAGVAAVGQPRSRVNARAAGYYHSDGRTWDVKTDASCGYTCATGWEIAAPALTMDADGECPELKAVLEQVKALSPRIDRKCGLHVHVELADFNWREFRDLLALWARYEPFFFELCPASRKSNHYCPPLRKTSWTGTNGSDWTRIEPALQSQTEHNFDRTARHAVPRGAVNVAHFWTSKRIEFRLAGGTIEYEKIQRWVQLLLALVARVKRGDLPPVAVGAWSDTPILPEYVFKVLALTEKDTHPTASALMDWAIARRAMFLAGGIDLPGRATTPPARR